MPELTPRQSAFVDYYLGECRGNATRAARKAGYAQPETQGPRLVRNCSVRQEIDRRLDERSMASNAILDTLTDHATATLADFVDLDDDGTCRLNLKKAHEAGKFHLIRKIKKTEHGLEIELHPVQPALELLGRFHGLWKAKDEGDKETTVADAVRSMQAAAAAYEARRVAEAG